MKTLIVITGATASGKTAFSVNLAKKLHTEIVSCDSRQFYKEMAIGTAKPSNEEMEGVPHHFIDSHSIKNEVNAGQFEKLALSCINTIFEKHETAILTGGSGLFIDAVVNGFDEMPTPKEGLRAQLTHRLEAEGLPILFEELKALDPVYAQEVDYHNQHRVIRALEICLSGSKPYSYYRAKKKGVRPFKIIQFVIDWPREQLYERINKRVDIMMKNGLLEEAQSLLPFKDLTPLNTVGYKELFAYFHHEISLEEAIELIKRNSRRYAKRQLTWFRRNPHYIWIKNTEQQKVLDLLNQ